MPWPSLPERWEMRRGSWERLGLAKVYLGLEGIEEGYVRHYDILLGRAIQRSGAW